MENLTNSVPDDYIDEIQTIDVVLTFIGSLLSIIGATVLFVTYFIRWRNKYPIDQPRQLLFFLTIADVFNAVGYMWGVASFVDSDESRRTNVSACHLVAEPSCIGQSFVTTWFSMSSFFWTTIIAFHLFWTYDESGTSLWKRNIVYHVLSWIVPFIITLVAQQQNVLGSDLSVGSGAWCWISACLSQLKRTIWMAVSGKGWEILMYFASCAFYMLIKGRKIRKRQHQKKVMNVTNKYTSSETTAQTDQTTQEDIRFLLLWLIEVGLRISGTIRFFIAAIRRHTDEKFLDYKPIDGFLLHIQSFGDSAQAFCSFLLFCLLDKETRELIKRYFFAKKRDETETQALQTQSVNIPT